MSATDLAVETSARPTGFISMRSIDWIWRVCGRLPLASGQSADEAFRRLDPVFQTTGTSSERTGQTITFRKKDQAAQDKMSIFDSGTLTFEQHPDGVALRYDMSSRALLFCFLAPFFFLGLAGVTIVIASHQKAQAQAELKAKNGVVDKKKEDAKNAVIPLNPIDKALGAPEPEKPKKDKDKNKLDDDKFPSPTSAYVFAGLFAALYVIGRVLEDRLVTRLFRKHLSTEIY